MPATKYNFDGQFNWQGEIHKFKDVAAVSFAQAFRFMTHGLSRKLQRSGGTVRSYFLSDGGSYKQSLYHSITKK